MFFSNCGHFVFHKRKADHDLPAARHWDVNLGDRGLWATFGEIKRFGPRAPWTHALAFRKGQKNEETKTKDERRVFFGFSLVKRCKEQVQSSALM